MSFIAASKVMKRVDFEITRLAKMDFDVLITGETGVGKDVVAREIHHRSQRRDKSFITVSLPTLSDNLIESELFGHERGAFSGADRQKIGRLEAANGETIYVPEISTLGERVQLHLLQFMQYKTICRVGQDSRTADISLDIRILYATNEDLDDLVSQGKLRADFYHRISGVQLFIPPLRERHEDIPVLADHFLRMHEGAAAGQHTLAPEVMDFFQAYPWPGNVRELDNWIKNALAHADGDILTLSQLPHFPQSSGGELLCRFCMRRQRSDFPNLKAAGNAFWSAYYRSLLLDADQNILRAAPIAGMTPQGLRKTLLRLGIRTSDDNGEPG